MKNPSVSNKPGFTLTTHKKVTMRRSLMAAVIALALLTSLTGIRPLMNGSKASAETSVKAEANLTGAQPETKLLSVAEAKAMSGGKMSDAEAEAFANFINTVAAEDVCWRDTSTRGVGTPLTSCPPGTTKEGLLCFKPCPAGYSTTSGDPLCHKDCPPGYTNDGLTCRKDAQIIAKTWKPCPSGWRDDGTACWVDLDIYGNGCSGNCKPGYTNDGCTCRRPPQRQAKEMEPCPPGFKDDGLTCRKDVDIIGRDSAKRDPVPMGCGPGKQEQAGLCYNACPGGSKGVGPVCWVDCPSSFPVNCGAACAKSRAQCATAVINMVASTGDMVLNIAGLVTGAGAAKAAIQAGVKAATKHALTAAGRRILLQKAKSTLRTQARKNGKEIAEEVLTTGAEALVGSYEKGEFDWTVLDPTGIAAVVEAFNKPICGT